MKKIAVGVAGIAVIAIIGLVVAGLVGKPVAAHNRIVVKVERPGFLDPLVIPQPVYVINTDGASEVHEKPPRGLGDEAEWSPDGQWIVYSTLYSSGAPEKSDIYLMQSNGGSRIRITDHRSGGSFNPTWSPDGTKVAYFAYDKNGSNDGIYILNVECFLSGEKCSPTPRFLLQGRTPNWSPDGKHIVYKPAYVGDGIFVLNADGTGKPIELTPPTVTICHDPKWSPDGTKIATTCYQQQKDTFEIFVINSDGAGAVTLTEGSMPSWSPDGSKIAFVSKRDNLGECIGGICGSGGVYSNAIFLMNSDGSNVVRLSLRDDESVLWYAWVR